MTRSSAHASGGPAYRLGFAVALVAAFLIVWATVVRDDGNCIGFFMVIMAATVGGVSAWFQPAGMARTMAGVAIMQGLLGVLIATAPSTAIIPGAPFKVLLSSGVFVTLWLVSAASFRVAAKADTTAAVAP